MKAGFLSVIGLVLVILRANNCIVMDWWITLASIFADLIISMLSEVVRQAKIDAAKDSLLKALDELNEAYGEDFEDDRK